MHEFSFSDISCPERHVVLNLPLRDFCIGHRLILLRQRNPLLWQSEPDFNALPGDEQRRHLLAAVTVCSLPMYPTRWQQFRHRCAMRRNRRARKHFTEADWALEAAKFRIYLAQSRLTTDFNERGDGGRPQGPFMPTVPAENSPGRSLGGPYDAALIQFLLKARLCASHAEAMEFPLTLAQAHFLTWLEREGALKILNSEEMDFKEYCADSDLKAARAAGFNTVAEHMAHVLAENAKAKANPQPSTPNLQPANG